MFSASRSGDTEFDSRGATEPIADLNPEDIESMSVLNGAAAAALYGSDAANGVIAITTKRGKAGVLSVTVSSNTEISTPFVTPLFQTRYGTGDLSSPVPVPNRRGDAGLTMQNPYWINYRNLRESDKDRYMLSASLNYQVLDWLSVSGRLRIDNSVTDYTERFYASTITQLTEDSNRGLYGITRTKDRQTYGDVLVNINKAFGDDWTLQANIGASISDMKSDGMKIRGPIADDTSAFAGEKSGLTNYFAIQNLSPSRTKRLQEEWREQTQSIFASAEIGFKGAYYLTLTGRNDWPSQLSGPRSRTKSYFYPSVGASIVLSSIIPNMPENLSYVKLRGSFASVGVAFERYLANRLSGGCHRRRSPERRAKRSSWRRPTTKTAYCRSTAIWHANIRWRWRRRAPKIFG